MASPVKHAILCLLIDEPDLVDSQLPRSSTTTANKRGRPRSSSDEIAAKRAPVLYAAGQLLADTHSSAMTVDQLIRAAGVSRPTFYRWFPHGIEQVIEQLIEQANRDLVLRLLTVAALPTGIEQRIEAGIHAYFAWCVELGAVTYGIYREGFDEQSPAYRYRQQTLSIVIELFKQQAQALKLASISDLYIETMVSWIESAAMVLCRRYPIDPADAHAQATLTTQMFLSTLTRSFPTWNQTTPSDPLSAE